MPKKKNAVPFSFFVVALLSNGACALEPNAANEEMMKNLLKLQVEMHESAQLTSYNALSLSDFPSTRPEGIQKSLALKSFSAPYDLFVWQQDGNLFAEVVPTSTAEVYVCSSSWILVQTVDNFVSAFNSTRFVSADGTTICGNYSQDVIFRITQWENLYDSLVDFSQPFNMVENQNADLAVLINGGVNGALASSDIGTISPNLDISIPLINLNTAEEKRKVWVELIFNGNSEDGSLSWKLGDAGYKE